MLIMSHIKLHCNSFLDYIFPTIMSSVKTGIRLINCLSPAYNTALCTEVKLLKTFLFNKAICNKYFGNEKKYIIQNTLRVQLSFLISVLILYWLPIPL